MSSVTAVSSALPDSQTLVRNAPLGDPQSDSQLSMYSSVCIFHYTGSVLAVAGGVTDGFAALDLVRIWMTHKKATKWKGSPQVRFLGSP